MMKIDWSKLGFEFTPTKSNIRFTFENGQWGPARMHNNYAIELSVAANCMHYGQAAFEGLKAFTCKDGKVRIFRPEENARRLNTSLRHTLMPEIPEEMFVNAVKTVIRDNLDFVPPYGTGGSLYIRPVVVGTSPQIGISASETYEFIVMVVPVGPYYKSGIKPMDAMIVDDIDRAAPSGTGHIKLAGNYAASLLPSKIAKKHGCQVALFLDARHHKYIEEFGTSNFIAITADGKYVTPKSKSILPSITNKSLMTIAGDLGITVEQRQVPEAELSEFAEVGACGTAVVITPIAKIHHADKIYAYNTDSMGPVLRRIYDRITGIQFGDLPDTHNWMTTV
jgi:branched-chain amino acid aminotransferase